MFCEVCGQPIAKAKDMSGQAIPNTYRHTTAVTYPCLDDHKPVPPKGTV